jgi:hypothetical protein
MQAWPHKMIAALAVALSFSAVLVGSTQAADRPDNRSGVRGIDSQTTGTSDVFTRAVARAHAVRAVRPDDRTGLRGVGMSPISTPVTPTDVVERAVLRHNASTSPRPDDRAGFRGIGTAVAGPAPLATTVSTGFHWADAGFGAAAALALVLILAGLVAARASQRRTQAILD